MIKLYTHIYIYIYTYEKRKNYFNVKITTANALLYIRKEASSGIQNEILYSLTYFFTYYIFYYILHIPIDLYPTNLNVIFNIFA